MEQNEISVHQVRIASCLRDSGIWMTNADIAKAANVSKRTARLHTHRLTQLGLLDQADVYPGHRFRWSNKADKRNTAYLQRLERAFEAFNMTAA